MAMIMQTKKIHTLIVAIELRKQANKKPTCLGGHLSFFRLKGPIKAPSLREACVQHRYFSLADPGEEALMSIRLKFFQFILKQPKCLTAPISISC